MFYFLTFLLFFFTHSEALKYTVCNCEEIAKTGECDNPNCIPICKIGSAIEAVNQEKAKQCMEKGLSKKSFSIEKVKLTELEDFLNTSVEAIKETKTKNETILETYCPDCELQPQTNVNFVPLTKKKNCAKKYLKSHEHRVRAVLNLTHSAKCNQGHIRQINEDFRKYVEKIIRKNNSPFSKKIYDECPDGCSFDVTYTVTTNKKKCLGDLDLKITCTHQAKTAFFIPIYDIVLNYEGNIKCQ